MYAHADSRLAEFVEHYALATDGCPYYFETIRRSVRQLEAFAGRPLWLSDLSDNLLNGWATHLAKDGCKPKTIRNKLSGVLCLWKAAFDTGRVDCLPRRVVRVKQPQARPVSWSETQFLRLAAAASRVTHYYRATGHRKADWWQALVWTVYDTGLRLTDCLALVRSQMTATGQISVVQHKTGRLHTVRVSPDTLGLIDRLAPFDEGPGRDGTVFGRPCSRSHLHVQFRALLKAAGLDGEHGQTRRIRRTSATQYERENPGRAWEHLGHTGPGLDRRAYVDRDQLPALRPLPPRPTPESTGA